MPIKLGSRSFTPRPFTTVLTLVVLLVAGVSIISGKYARLSALIIGVSLFTFILLAMFGVLHKAQEIKQQHELTKALNSQSSSGEMVWIPEGKMTMGAWASRSPADQRGPPRGLDNPFQAQEVHA